jgi:hypothetical protein
MESFNEPVDIKLVFDASAVTARIHAGAAAESCEVKDRTDKQFVDAGGYRHTECGASRF